MFAFRNTEKELHYPQFHLRKLGGLCEILVCVSVSSNVAFYLNRVDEQRETTAFLWLAFSHIGSWRLLWTLLPSAGEVRRQGGLQLE